MYPDSGDLNETSPDVESSDPDPNYIYSPTRPTDAPKRCFDKVRKEMDRLCNEDFRRRLKEVEEWRESKCKNMI